MRRTHLATRLALAAPLLAGGPALAAKIVPDEAKAEPFLRVVEEDQRIGLEVATQHFVRPEGGPRVSLVAVAHIGEAAFYEELQEQLDGFDVVLYELVLPPGADGAADAEAGRRSERTRAAMEFVGSLVETHRVKRRAYPESMDDLTAYLDRRDSRLARWCRRAAVDAWDRPLEYRVVPASEVVAGGWELTSYGADGEPGGTGAAADLVIGSGDGVAPLPLSGDENLQSQLASALGLDFQLDAIDYDRATWRNSDLAIDQIEAAMVERGVDFGPFSSTMSGTSLSSRVIKFLLKTIRLADFFLDGAIADTCKVVLIEMLGDEALMEQSLEQMGEGFSEVLIDLRNMQVVKDLQHVVETEPDVESVAIFYGAAHMPDFRERLNAMGYAPSSDHPAQWTPAIEVDLAESAVSEQEIQQLRTMIRQMMRAR